MSQSTNNKSSNLSSKPKFSRQQLMIFAALFAVVGGFIIWKSFAAEVSVGKTEAESMVVPPGATTVANSAASGGTVVKMTSNGSLTGTVTLSDPATSVQLNAYSSKCRKSWSNAVVKVDGNQVLSSTVNSSALKTFSAPVTIAAGQHTLEVSFTGVTIKSCTTALSVDNVVFMGQSSNPQPTVSLTANPTSVTSGQSSTLTWSSTNATSCTANGAWTGTKAVSGTQSVAPTQSSTYGISCTGAGGSATASATVNVTATPPPPPPPPALSTPNMTVVPSTLSGTVGSTITVEIRENSGTTPVNAVQANISYPTNLMEFVSINESGSAFGTGAQGGAANGVVYVARGISVPVSGNPVPLTGDQSVIKVVFKLTSAGTANLNFTTGTALLSSTTNQNILGALSTSTRGLVLTIN